MPHATSHNPRILVVITIFNGREITADCLRSLEKSEYRDFSPLIIDNASSDGSKEYLEKEFPGLEVIRNEQNLGVSRAYNRGLREGLARGCDYILIMNSDVILEPDCLTLMVERALAPDAPAVVAPLMLYYDRPDTAWFCGGYLDFERQEAAHCRSLEEFNALPQSRRYITACAMMMRADAVRKTGWVDENIFMYCDDTDYTMRFVRCGFTMELADKARLYHRVSSSSGGVGKDISPFHAYHILRSEMYFWRKHLGWWAFHRRYCRGHLGKWVNQLPDWNARNDRREAAASIIDAVWYQVSGKRDPLGRPKAPDWFRAIMVSRPWVIANLMAFRWPGAA